MSSALGQFVFIFGYVLAVGLIAYPLLRAVPDRRRRNIYAATGCAIFVGLLAWHLQWPRGSDIDRYSMSTDQLVGVWKSRAVAEGAPGCVLALVSGGSGLLELHYPDRMESYDVTRWMIEGFEITVEAKEKGGEKRVRLGGNPTARGIYLTGKDLQLTLAQETPPGAPGG